MWACWCDHCAPFGSLCATCGARGVLWRVGDSTMEHSTVYCVACAPAQIRDRIMYAMLVEDNDTITVET